MTVDAPDVAPRASRKQRRKDLTTQVEAHDHQQLEVRFNYALGVDQGDQHYQVDTYLFIPRSMGVNRENYSRDQFYGDVTALMRLDAAPLPLDQLADPNEPHSPLHRLHEALERFRTLRRPPASAPVQLHVKLYAYLYTVGVRAEMRVLEKRLERDVRHGITAAGREEFEHTLARTLPRLRRGLDAFRAMRHAFWPFEKLADASLADAMRSADEFMSLFLEERLGVLLLGLEKDPRQFDGSGFVPRVRQALTVFCAEEARHRQRFGYLSLRNDALEAGEFFTYRASLLKKSVHQALYLNTRGIAADNFVRQAVAAVGAALAAIWALATQLPSGLSHAAGRTTEYLVLTAAVLAYVAKDRIKSVSSEVLLKYFRKHDHAATLHGDALQAVGLGMLNVRLREVVRFESLASVPPGVRQMRAARKVYYAESQTEEVVHYRKLLDVRAGVGTERMPEGYRVRDILRFNVRHFLVRLDDPVDTVTWFDPDQRRFARAGLPKVYHLNLVIAVRRLDATGAGHERLEHIRLVLDKQGIVRVEKVDSRELSEVRAAPRVLRRLRRRGTSPST